MLLLLPLNKAKPLRQDRGFSPINTPSSAFVATNEGQNGVRLTVPITDSDPRFMDTGQLCMEWPQGNLPGKSGFLRGF